MNGVQTFPLISVGDVNFLASLDHQYHELILNIALPLKEFLKVIIAAFPGKDIGQEVYPLSHIS